MKIEQLASVLLIATITSLLGANIRAQPDADKIWRDSQRSGICTLHHVQLKRHTVTFYMWQGPPDLHVREYNLMERKYPNVREAIDDRFRPRHFPCKITVGVCRICQKHFDDELPQLFTRPSRAHRL
jgi:hypothetical protein